MSVSRRSSATYVPESTAVPAARGLVRRTLRAWGLPYDRVEDAVLIASELVTNAVVHAGTDVRLSCLLDAAGTILRVEVRDELPMRRVEEPHGVHAPGLDGAQAHLSDGHRGLVLTHSLADSWGVTYSKTSKTVWFEFEDAASEPVEPAPTAAPPPPIALPPPQPGPATAPAPAMTQPAPAEVTTLPIVSEPPEVGLYPAVAVSPGMPATAATAAPAAMSASPMLVAPGGAAPVAPADVAPEAPERLPAERMFDHVVQWARASTGADVAYVLVSTEDDALAVRATATAASDDPAAPVPPEGAALRSLDTARLALATHEDAGIVTPSVGSRFRSLATAPLKAGGKRLGLVVVSAEEADRFGAADVARLEYAATSLAPVVARERQAAGQQGYRGWLGFLAEANDLLAGTLDEKLVLALAAQLFVPRIASWCAVYLSDQGGKGVLAHIWHADEQRIRPLRELLESCPAPGAFPVREPRRWNALDVLGPADRAISGPEALELPLACREHRLGSIVLGAPDDGSFRPELARFAEDLTDRFALALLNARRYGEQVAVSQILQSSLLPDHLPQIPGIDHSIVYMPAGQDAKAGGDFYDLFAAGPERWRFMLGDVCGTGAAAAAVTGLARHTLRALGREGHSAARALDRLNEAMLDSTGPKLLTAVHGELEMLGSGGVRVSMTVAGHPLPLRLRPDGVVEPIGDSQLLVGAVTDPDYRLDSVVLDRGDVLLLVTDGITERRRGYEQLDDDDGLARLLSECTGLTARAVSLRIQAAVRDFSTEPLDDDMAILVLRVE
ncbi:SpoIIE family protein phosphatase [Actinomadura barringtoniae]|uniref:SpoIIE family protein phosphatase n=1 Tax=Actinomadura barringtoniae TaxID=1427535 RepID=A0A939TDD9_9ACTN|nr:SpoIIE family protein phosphatase [Actinomadura barringtoniae]MBO2455482.1 SpoIIE family protein phosphatase [Actinomadura barringtoniae]